MAAGGGLLKLWTDWGIQILVLVSLSLQVLLLIFGEMRRRGLSAWQSATLWFAYQLADSTAIFTLGHLSITAGSEQGRLAAFWAPFLLLHLGGPHNITAYALEDNRLWLRHLQTLVVQAVGAAYVLYKFYHAGGGGTLLTLASVSMFVAGLAKYGERTWALRCANKTCRSSDRTEDNVVDLELNDDESPTEGKLDDNESLTEDNMGDENILLQAHTQLPTCRRFLFDDANVKGVFDLARRVPVSKKKIFKLVEMELSLLYDTLYTKVPVIHTWYGFCIHFISMVGTSAALCFFHLSRGRSNNNNQGQGYNSVDIVISYVLLAGALVLEIISACRALLSTWTCTLFLIMGLEYTERDPSASARCLAWLLEVLYSLHKHLKLASRRLWRRGTMGQYNLLHLATRDRTDLGSRLAAKLGLQDSWDKLCFSYTFSGTDSLSMPELKERLKKCLLDGNIARCTVDTRGRYTLEHNGELFDGIAQWAVKDAMFDESIVIWHIATDIFISQYSTAPNYDIECVEATRVLSNYMMFLLVAKPKMLPGRERRYVHLNASRELKKFLQDGHVKELFHHQGPDCFSGISEELAKALHRRWTHNELFQQTLQAEKIESDSNLETFLRSSLLACAAGLATQLLRLDWDRLKTLEVIFEVWVEMMLYAAENCPRDSHARELGNGGELMTIAWLLVKHYIQAGRNNGSNSPAESGGEVGGPLAFTADDLLCATAEIMGKRNICWTVYKTTLEDGNLVAVMRLWKVLTKGDMEFEAEAALLRKIRHPNLLALRAYFPGTKGDKLLVSDYMPKGSLSAFLHARAPNTPLDWATRMIIAKGTARGLAYLHDDMSIIHGNLTASKVLLDEQNNPKISYFGLSRLMTAAANSKELVVAGALGYLAPELSKLEKANAKTDVYSLGIIILELLTGEFPKVASIVKEEWTSEVFDLELRRDAAAGNVGDELMDTLKLALHCVDPWPSVRPDAREVLRQLEQIRPGNEGGAGPSEEGHVPLSAGGRGEKPAAEAESGGGDVGGKLVHFDGPLAFTADDLLKTTAEIMGKSTYGTVYKATLEDGSLVAVKRLREKITKGHKEFAAETAVLGKIRHPNLLALRAYYLGPEGDKVLVFDYMPKGSLSAFLHARAPNTPVDWTTRMIIAKGTARGLTYLHDNMNIIHGNLTASKVLLDEQNNPKISDFGLLRLMRAAADSFVLEATGALQYLPWNEMYMANAKTDVYSLGVIILELLTGKSPADRTNAMNLPEWVAFMIKAELTSKVFDRKLMHDAAAGNVGDELMDMLKLALRCVDPSRSVRPDAREVLRQLEQIRPGSDGGAGPSEEGHVPLSAGADDE